MSKTPNNPKKTSSFNNKPRIATLHNMSQSQRSSDDEEEGQAFYAGGSERSGQQVLGPPKQKEYLEHLTEMFRRADKSGITNSSSSNILPIASTSRNRNTFYEGAGLRLGQTDDDHSVVAVDDDDTPVRPINIEAVKIKLWKQGFSINDGEIRLYDDDTNKEFLETVMRGQVPDELREIGTVLSVDVEDHRHEEYKMPGVKAKTFKGSGHTLGSPAPKADEKPAPIKISPGNPESNKVNEEKAIENLKLDSDQPTTMLQIRLSDGTRLSARFNLTHTIDDVRNYIITSRPQYEFHTFMLVTSFPTRELCDGSQTIQDAGIANASLMLRLM